MFRVKMRREGEKWRGRRRWKSTKSHRCVVEVVLFVIVVVVSPTVIIAAGVVEVAAVTAVRL